MITGDGELGFDSGEGARETATTSKEGSRRANYPIPTRGGSDNKYRYGPPSEARNRNENDSNPLTRNDWRASLVPAAAVIPAPTAYIKVVAVKKLVVEPWNGGGPSGPPRAAPVRPEGRAPARAFPPTGRSPAALR